MNAPMLRRLLTALLVSVLATGNGAFVSIVMASGGEAAVARAAATDHHMPTGMMCASCQRDRPCVTTSFCPGLVARAPTLEIPHFQVKLRPVRGLPAVRTVCHANRARGPPVPSLQT